jgi:phosphoenolpyruvate synthase/pyruvate phosphate dikinase
VVVRNVNTKVHLMSSLDDKMELVNSIIWVTHKGGLYVPPFFTLTQHTYRHTMNQTQQTTVSLLSKLITEKYEELLWNECYYDGDNQQIKDLLGSLQSEGVEVNFEVTLKPYKV